MTPPIVAAGTHTVYPPMNASQAIALCCQLGDECQGFSIENAAPSSMPRKGCLKKNLDGGVSRNSMQDGYSKSPPVKKCEQDGLAATVFTAYQSHVIIVLASWCDAAVTISLNIDWPMLGFATAPRVFAPTIGGWQKAADFGNGSLPFTLTPEGVILVARPEDTAFG